MSLSILIEKSARARRFGLLASVRCRLQRGWLGLLRHAFHFDAWHAAAPFACRPYKRKVVELANSLHATTAVEVGCGLGDILSRVRARKRFGFDADPAVIRAARFLHPLAVHWIPGDDAAVARRMPANLVIDCLITVNWIHNLSAERLSAFLLPLLPRVRYLIVDAIDPDGPGSYRFRHNFDFLQPFAECAARIPLPGEPRHLLLFKVS